MAVADDRRLRVLMFQEGPGVWMVRGLEHELLAEARTIGSAPPSHTPSTSRSPDPIMKSTWMALRFPPARSNAASSIDSPPRIVNLYAVPSATWLAAFSSNSVL